jgi:hypothetical protein
MPFASQITHQSKALPGVAFVVHRIGFSRRTDIDMSTLATGLRKRELTAAYPPPTDQEKPILEQIAIAEKKALAVPADQMDAVMKADVEPLQTELAALPIPDEIRRTRDLLNREYAAVDRMERAEWVRAGLVSIEDKRDVAPEYNLSGITAEQLLGDGPAEMATLVHEIYLALIEDGRLRGENSKTRPSPITSGEAAAGESQSTTAPDVEVQPAVTT